MYKSIKLAYIYKQTSRVLLIVRYKNTLWWNKVLFTVQKILKHRNGIEYKTFRMTKK